MKYGADSTKGADSSNGTNSGYDSIPSIPILSHSATKPTPIPTPEKNGVITPLVLTVLIPYNLEFEVYFYTICVDVIYGLAPKAVSGDKVGECDVAEG